MKKIFALLTITIILTSFALAVPMTGSATNDDSENPIQAQSSEENSEDSEDETEIEIEEGDDEEGEIEVEVEIEDDGSRKIKVKAKSMNAEQVRATIQERNRLRINQTGECPKDCTCEGSTTKCQLEDGSRQMTIRAGNSGNMIIQTKKVEAETEVELYQSENKVYAVSEDGKLKQVKLMPDQVVEKVRERLRIQNCSCDEIVLDQDGNYQVQTQKQAKLLGLFKVQEKVKFEYNAETGELIRQRNSWWSFLTTEDEEEPIVGSSCGTVTPGQNDACCQNKGYDSWNEEKAECVFAEQ